MCAFNPRIFQGASISQVREALNYSTFLITREQEEELKGERMIQPVVETDWKQVVEKNEIVYPAGPVGVVREELAPQRVTGTNLYD